LGLLEVIFELDEYTFVLAPSLDAGVQVLLEDIRMYLGGSRATQSS
jgi:hypothetical protein